MREGRKAFPSDKPCPSCERLGRTARQSFLFCVGGRSVHLMAGRSQEGQSPCSAASDYSSSLDLTSYQVSGRLTAVACRTAWSIVVKQTEARRKWAQIWNLRPFPTAFPYLPGDQFARAINSIGRPASRT